MCQQQGLCTLDIAEELQEAAADGVQIYEILFACLMCLPLSQLWFVTTHLWNRVFQGEKKEIHCF